jgi:hypothetical protein
VEGVVFEDGDYPSVITGIEAQPDLPPPPER